MADPQAREQDSTADDPRYAAARVSPDMRSAVTSAPNAGYEKNENT
jgi:hypothetical protein